MTSLRPLSWYVTECRFRLGLLRPKLLLFAPHYTKYPHKFMFRELTVGLILMSSKYEGKHQVKCLGFFFFHPESIQLWDLNLCLYMASNHQFSSRSFSCCHQHAAKQTQEIVQLNQLYVVMFLNFFFICLAEKNRLTS